MSNALRWRPQLREGDVVRVPFAEVPIAAIDPHDIAAVARVVLGASDRFGHALALSGPAALRPAEQLAVLSRVLGRSLRLEAVPDDEAARELAASFPPAFVEAQLRFFARGEFDDSSVVTTVEAVTGRPARTFEDWARAHASAFA
jgi:uncharacterized protein YbjT (DUF2867 family)